jgi:hypothetical protein
MERSDEKVSQVRGNFNRIARDLDRALRASRLSEAQRFLFDEARELSWSFAADQPLPFRINISACAVLHGFDRPWLSQQFRSLVLMKFFVDLGDGSYLINKRYIEWTQPDGTTRRLSDAQINWCKQIRRKVRIGVHTTQSGLLGTPISPVGCTKQSGFNEVVGVPNKPPYLLIQSLFGAPNSPVLPPLKPPIKERASEEIRVSEERGGEPPPANAPLQIRSPEDAEIVRRAVALLRGDIRTEPLGIELLRLENLPEMLAIPGWKFVRAAERILSPDIPDAKRRRWPYFLGIARSITDDERHAPVRPTRNGRHPAPVPLPPPAREVTNGRHVNLVPPRPKSKPDSRKEPDARD